MGEATKTTLGDLAKAGHLEFGDGYRTKRAEHGKPGIPILRVAEVLDGKILPALEDYVSDAYRDSMGQKISQPGDVVLTTKGTVGRVAIMPSNSPEFVYSPQLCYFRLRPGSPLLARYLYYWFKSEQFWSQARSRKSQTDMADYLNLADIRSLEISLPELREQQAVTSVLGALDDKIAVNERIAATTRELGQAIFHQAVRSDDAEERELASVAEFLSRGVTPRYTDDNSQLMVLNQKCIRYGRVILEQARRTMADKVPPLKLLKTHDVLVNSTGVGTLGRVARWTADFPCTVDSHVTIVRFDATKVDPVCAGFAMLAAQSEIERLGEGSTGQTELSRTKLGALRILLPSPRRVAELRASLDSLEARGEAALAEATTLAELRDTLLPKLMSGELRVRDAEKAVEEAL